MSVMIILHVLKLMTVTVIYFTCCSFTVKVFDLLLNAPLTMMLTLIIFQTTILFWSLIRVSCRSMVLIIFIINRMMLSSTILVFDGSSSLRRNSQNGSVQILQYRLHNIGQPFMYLFIHSRHTMYLCLLSRL